MLSQDAGIFKKEFGRTVIHSIFCQVFPIKLFWKSRCYCDQFLLWSWRLFNRRQIAPPSKQMTHCAADAIALIINVRHFVELFRQDYHDIVPSHIASTALYILYL